jgi:hypothetical protein
MVERIGWLKRLQGWGARPTRRQRRFLVGVCLITPVVFYLMAIFDLHPWRDLGRLYGIAAFINALLAMGMGTFLLRLVRRQFSAVSLEDRARLAYGMAFEELTEMQRDRVRWGLQQELRDGSRPPDEREAALQRDAEGRAFRVLQRGLPVLVVVYWGVCLSVPIGPVRVGLLISAVAISGLVIAVLALPEVIRVWMMPDELGEPRVMSIRGREV